MDKKVYYLCAPEAKQNILLKISLLFSKNDAD
jgi:hypothetical protein